jgi:hypothetical protein
MLASKLSMLRRRCQRERSHIERSGRSEAKGLRPSHGANVGRCPWACLMQHGEPAQPYIALYHSVGGSKRERGL